jgi:hypothetical protein
MSGRWYPEFTTKHESTRTDAELAELREKYKAGVPAEIIDHMADKMADQFIAEGKCGDILDKI